MPICTSKQAAIIVVFPMWLGILHYHRKQPFISFFLWFQFHVCMKGILPSNCDLTSNIGSSFPPVLSDTQAARSPCSCLGWGDHNIILENRVMWQNMLGPGCHMANPCLYWHTLMANKTCSVRFLTQTQYHPIPSHNSIPYYIYTYTTTIYINIYIYMYDYPQLVTSSHLPIAVRPLSACHVGRKAASAWCKTRWGFWT